MAKQKKKSSFRGKVGEDAQRKKREGSSYGYLQLPKGVNVFSPEPDSRVKLDFMPYIVSDKNHPDRNEKAEVAEVGSQWWKRPFSIHRNIGSGDDTVVCLASFGKACPICEYRAKRMKEGAPEEELKDLRPSKRSLYAVIPLDAKKFEKKVHLFDISNYLFEHLLFAEIEEDEDYEVFPDLEDGLTLKVRFNSNTIGKGKPFAEASRIDFLERDEPYDESILDSVPDLDKVLIQYSYDDLQAKFFEIEKERSSDENEDDEEEESPRKKKQNKPDPKDAEEEDEKPERKKKKAVIEEEDEDDDDEKEDEDDDDEKEDEIPVKKSVARKKKKVVVEEEDEDEDDEDEDDEDEEEVPKKSSSKSTKKQASSTSTKKEKCPHGHRFGIDTEEFDECDNCKIWDACLDKKES